MRGKGFFIKRCLAILLCLVPSGVAGAQDEFMLVERDLDVLPIRLVELSETQVVHVDGTQWHSVPIEDCACLIRPEAIPVRTSRGLVILADGQELPGQAVSGAAPGDRVLTWTHVSWGRIEIPMNRIAVVLMERATDPPTAGDGDVVLLANGDRIDGFITSLGDPMTIEIEDEDGIRSVEIPRDRVAAVRMITPTADPNGRRVWFEDGTIIDVSSIEVKDDGYARLGSDWLDEGSVRVALTDILAVRFDSSVLRPLASIRPALVEGPPTRYRIPPPVVVDRETPVGLATVVLSGPVVVHYALPEGTTRFSAEAVLPIRAREWGDLELVIRDEGEEVYRGRLNAGTPAVSINVPLRGAELTIELTAGAFGPIQDLIELHYAMFGVE